MTTKKESVTEPWTNTNYPNVSGWMRTTHIRGPNDQREGYKYYTYHPPSGNCKQLRSLTQVNKRMEQDQKREDNDDVVIITPDISQPDIIDLTNDKDQNENIYTNVTLAFTPGGGLHIKWNH